jgi:hypothetical protein
VAEHDSVIPAGGSGKLTAKVKTSVTQFGKISKSISVTTDATGAERLSLNVRFTAVASIEVLPRPQVYLSGTEGDEIVRYLLVRRRDGAPLEITGINHHDPRILVTTEKLEAPRTVGELAGREGDILMTIATAPDLEAQGINGRFRFATNHPDVPNVAVSYALRLRPVIEARPTQVRLILQEGNEPARSAMMRVHHNRSDEFKITAAEPSKPELFTAELIDGDVDQQVHTVAVILDEDVQAGALQRRAMETLVLTTDDPDNPEVKVSVLIEPRGLRRPGKPRPLE